MLFEAIQKSEDFALLEREFKAGRLAKSVMLISEDALAAKNLALALSALIFDGEIDVHSENYKKVQALSHPDLKIYPKNARLLVEDSQEIVMESYVKPILAQKKVFLICGFDEANEASQNKLLKVLEEPQDGVYFILTACALHKVLPTIRSRCQKQELKKMDFSLFQDEFLGFSREDVNLLEAISCGQIGTALALKEQSDIFKLCDEAVGIVCKLKNSKQVLEYAKGLLVFKDRLPLILKILSLALVDLVALKCGQNVKLSKYKSQMEVVATDFSMLAIVEITSLISKAEHERVQNVSPNLIIENLLLNILEVKYLCR